MVGLGVWPVSPVSAAQVLGHTARDHLHISGFNLGRDQCKAPSKMRAVRLLIVRLSTGHGLVLLRARATGQHGPNNLVDTPRLYFLYLNPILCDGDGPIAKYRKWFTQFYSG